MLQSLCLFSPVYISGRICSRSVSDLIQETKLDLELPSRAEEPFLYSLLSRCSARAAEHPLPSLTKEGLIGQLQNGSMSVVSRVKVCGQGEVRKHWRALSGTGLVLCLNCSIVCIR